MSRASAEDGSRPRLFDRSQSHARHPARTRCEWRTVPQTESKTIDRDRRTRDSLGLAFPARSRGRRVVNTQPLFTAFTSGVGVMMNVPLLVTFASCHYSSTSGLCSQACDACLPRPSARNYPRNRQREDVLLLENNVGQILIWVGVVFLLAGFIVLLLERAHIPLGRLPGDVVWRRNNTTVYFPWVSCLLLSLLGTLVIWLLNRR